MNDLKMMQILNGKQKLKHPSCDYFLLYQFLDLYLSFQMILQVSLLAVLLNHICPFVFLDDFVQRDDVGMRK